MTNIIMTKATNSVDGAIKKKVWAFMEKLAQSDELPGLHIEPMKNPTDPRARTGRVDDNFRAVLFRLEGQAGEPTYVYVGTWPHDRAIEIACSRRLQVNPINGVAELIAEPLPTSEDLFSAAPLPSPSRSRSRREEAETEVSLLRAIGISPRDLVDRLGMESGIAERAFAALTEDALLEVAGLAPDWQGMALLDIAAGTAIDEVVAALDVAPRATPDRKSDQTLIDAMRHPASQMTFAFVHDNDELRRVIEEGSFANWRIFLHPEQRRYVERNFNGPFRLSGGAGTGKTVVLLHRAARLARQNPQARIILTTYTVNLAENIKRDLRALDEQIPLATALGQPGIYVNGIDALASAALKLRPEAVPAATEAIFGEPRLIKGVDAASDRWSSALAASGVSGLPAEIASPTFLAEEYESIVLPNTISTRERYFTVRRPGRHVALDRSKRDQIWKVIAAYRALHRMEGTADFDEIAAVAAQVFDAAGVPRPADHVLVDEGQDLVPAKWRLLRSLAPEGVNDLFIAEDSHQRIYGARTVLSRWGIRVVGRSQRLTLNYRTTAQNLGYAVAVLKGGDYEDLESEAESTAGYRSSRIGPHPERRGFTSLIEELDYVANLIKGWIDDDPKGSLAVLVRTQGLRDTVARALSERGVPASAVDRVERGGSNVAVMTLHRAKGVEFSRVCIVGAGADNIPNPAVMKSAVAHGAEGDAELRERSLLYVGATRARDVLSITWTGEPSRLLSSVETGA
ncbi:UvrD-helicase domain-containing protein [Herbiconiux sp. SYSU D00978]|uniref:UvrD-helicase domain-containing protein n=1 Tax=Herbiconiux sp. SYSU D00978 TaxID=2812562 RepID=UPI001A967D60|nr:UvrD-helicase domain-containing protein [Herbiconiux sp. SYSU D00978]